MPGVDGATATAQVRQRLPGTQVLVLTTARHPVLPSTKCYQVWVMGTHRMRSAGRLPTPKLGMTAPVIISGIAPGDRMGVTVEPAGGSRHPTSPPVLMLALPSA